MSRLNPLRIVQVVQTLAVGGLETMAVNLAIAHRRAGHESAIYTVGEAGALERTAREAGVAVVPFRKKPGFHAGTLLAMARTLRGAGVDVVHTHNGVIHHYGALAARLAGAGAVVNTRHGLAFHSMGRQELYYRATMPLTQAVVFVCEDGRRHYVGKGLVPEAKSSIILNGIPLERFQERRARPGSARPRIRFGTVGRLVKAKAHLDLVEAFARIAPELPDAELHIWGDGENRGALLERIGGCGYEDRIHYHGAAADSAEALRTVDVFVLSSISEGLPLVILEAMAAGLPVVSTRVGGVPEVAPDGVVARYCRPGDPSGLAEAMLSAARGDLAGPGETAFRLAEERFGLTTMQAQYEELFRYILRRRGRRGGADSSIWRTAQ